MPRYLFLCVGLFLPAIFVAGCSTAEKARSFADAAVAVQQELGLEALRQAEIERQRLRSARCYSPALTPAAVSAAAEDAELGQDWVEELLRDCPQFSTFVSNLVVSRAASVGMTLP
ncbi:MAG: hypothetical protein JNM75_08910 [Rhodospirillales bacterium]|nr:hypothetical protein [Rhodospirillales bacterium]